MFMKFKKNLIRLTNFFLASLLALFGFSNCNDVRMEYGVPNADYSVKGKVTDMLDSKPIKGIRVAFSPYPQAVTMYGILPASYRSYKADTTEVSGTYDLTDNFSIGEIQNDTIPVYVQDIDGEENGLYQDTIIKVGFKDAVKSGKQSNWYDGKFTVEKNIEMKRK